MNKNYFYPTLLGLTAVVCAPLLRAQSKDDKSTAQSQPAPAAATAAPTAEPTALPTGSDAKAHAKRMDTMTRAMLTQLLQQPELAENPTMSPLAIATALEALHAAAAGDTARELAKLLAYPENQTPVPAADPGSTWQWLASRPQPADGSINHGLWYHQGHPLLTTYTDLVKKLPSLELAPAPFGQASAITTLGDWSKKHSGGKITQPVSPSMISDLSRIVWVSLLDYQGKWQQSFDPKSNTTVPFRSYTGESQVTMMHQNLTLKLSQQEGYGTVALIPMSGQGSVLEIRLPEKALSRREITAWLALPAPVASTDRMVHLGFPKTELRSSISWIDSLRAIGAKELLLEANLANATQERGLRLSELATETSLRFDEEGAKIASSAAAVVSARGIPSEEIQLILDRPFAWAIREVETGIPLAAGIMERPTLPQPARPAAATANDSPVK